MSKKSSHERKRTKKKSLCPSCNGTGVIAEECLGCMGYRCESCGWGGYVTRSCDLCRYVDKHGKTKIKSFPQRQSHGHYCRACGRRRANEKFSGKGHAAHICKACAVLQRAEAKRKRRGLPPIPSEEYVELNYENWDFYPWEDDFPHETFSDEGHFAGNWDRLLQFIQSSEDRAALRQFKRFTFYAAQIAQRLTVVSEVRKITLFDVLARPPVREPHPTSPRLRDEGVRIFVAPKSVQLAIEISSTDNLAEIRSIRKQFIAATLKGGNKISVDMIRFHFFASKSSQYLGRLCNFKRCGPEKEREICQVDGCGQPRHLKIEPGFEFETNAFAKENCQVLFERKTKT